MKFQRGGFFLGMIVGLLIGLALALVVAMYVTKVPLPFVDKVPQRTAEQDAAEIEHNKNWDPNSPLYGGNPAKPKATASAPAAMPEAPAASAAPTPVLPPPVTPAALPATPSAPTPPAASAAKASTTPAAAAPASTRNPAAILSSGGETPSPSANAEAFSYYVQAGAYGSEAEAEQQRAKLAIMGLESQITQREVNGRTMHRVRLGPFPQKDQAEDVRTRLSAARVESGLVRVAR